MHMDEAESMSCETSCMITEPAVQIFAKNWHKQKAGDGSSPFFRELLSLLSNNPNRFEKIT
jgi:hypothetical protein